MANYFRITAYHPTENLSVIMDSNGLFEKLWQFSSFMVSKGFKIIEVGGETNSTTEICRKQNTITSTLFCVHAKAVNRKLQETALRLREKAILPYKVIARCEYS